MSILVYYTWVYLAKLGQTASSIIRNLYGININISITLRHPVYIDPLSKLATIQPNVNNAYIVPTVKLMKHFTSYYTRWRLHNLRTTEYKGGGVEGGCCDNAAVKWIPAVCIGPRSHHVPPRANATYRTRSHVFNYSSRAFCVRTGDALLYVIFRR